MKAGIITTLLFSIIGYLHSQETEPGKARFVIGLSAPELIHLGFSYRISNSNQLETSIGAFPSWGEFFTAISLEHRLYLGKNNNKINQKTWFFKQGTTYWFLPDDITLTFTVGKDIPFKNSNTGVTIDFGLTSLREKINFLYGNTIFDTKYYWQKYPALRFELYFS